MSPKIANQAVDAKTAHMARQHAGALTKAIRKPHGNYSHDTLHLGVVNQIHGPGIDGQPPSVDIYPNGAQQLSPSSLMKAIPYLASYTPNPRDVVIVVTQPMGKSRSLRYVLGKVDGTPSPYQTLLGSCSPNLLYSVTANPTWGLGGWQEHANCDVFSTVNGLAVRSINAGNMSAETGTSAFGIQYRVATGHGYTATAFFATATTARSCTLAINWYDASNNFLLTSTGGAITDGVAPVQATVSANAPPLAVFASLVATVESAGASETHNVSAITLNLDAYRWSQGPNSLWGGGGPPTIPITPDESSGYGAMSGDWYLQTDAANLWQLQDTTWVLLPASSFQSPISPPISGTTYQNTTSVKWQCSLSVTMNPGASNGALVEVAIGPSAGSLTTWASLEYNVGATELAGSNGQLSFPVPPGWYYEVTATDAVLNTLVAISES